MSEERENIGKGNADSEYLDLLKERYNADLSKENENGIIKGEEASEKFGIIAEEDEEFKIDENGTFKRISPPPMKKKPEKTKKESKNKFVLWCKNIPVWYKGLPKKKKIIFNILCIVLVLLIVLGTSFGIFVANKFKIMGDNFNSNTIADDDTIYDEDDFADISGSVGASGFNEALKEWATTGNNSIMKSKNVINVLLLGADSRQGTNSGNTDVMMVVSLNRKTKQVKLISFFRDSYLYIEHEGRSCFNKLNAAYSFGGAECVMTTIEHNYKIDIDNFVMVNFESFQSVIDAMGGINIDVEKYEADYINSFSKFKKCDMPYGENVKLNGLQALYFCRIRGCYANADVSRTHNQRKVIETMMDKVQSASLGSLNKYVDTILPYVYTGFSQSQILSLGMKAVTGGWSKYKRTQLQMPSEDARTSGYAGSAWIWVVDYQLAAHELQEEIYGTSNIVLNDGRRTLIDVYEGREATGTSDNGYSSYDEPEDNIPVDSGNTSSHKKDDNNVPSTTEVIKIPATTVPETTENVTDVTLPPETEPETTEPVTEEESPTEEEPVVTEEAPTEEEPVSSEE